jgi:hypothetical protein
MKTIVTITFPVRVRDYQGVRPRRKKDVKNLVMAMIDGAANWPAKKNIIITVSFPKTP